MTKRSVLVVGHADADGHVIAEQTRRNLALVSTFDVHTVVDPARTLGHKSWTHLDRIIEIDRADWIIFVDLMFSPDTFVSECSAFVAFAHSRPTKRFFVIDHHPLPQRRLTAAPNISAVYRPEVFECTLGPRSGLMVLAALCERQFETTSAIRQPHHIEIARGLMRAAAVGGELPGKKLMALLKADRWDAIRALGQEGSEFHRLVRGRRVPSVQRSPGLQAVEALAGDVEELVFNANKWTSGGNDSGSRTMPYDLAAERYGMASRDPRRYENAPRPTNDLEALVTLLEMAALSLTNEPEATFTFQQLMDEAREIAGESIAIDDKDSQIVLQKASFLQWLPDKQLRLR